VTGNGRLYKLANWVVNAPPKVLFSQDGTHVHIEAWIQTNALFRLMFSVPAEMTLASGGYVGSAARSIGRGDVNMLLSDFKQPLIP
jgi:hypothetical protein